MFSHFTHTRRAAVTYARVLTIWPLGNSL